MRYKLIHNVAQTQRHGTMKVNLRIGKFVTDLKPAVQRKGKMGSRSYLKDYVRF